MAESFKERLKRALPVWKQMLKRSTPFVRQTAIAGGAAGNLTVSAIKKNDELVSVIEVEVTTAALTDRTSEFTILDDATIDNTGGTATTGDSLLVTWLAWDAD